MTLGMVPFTWVFMSGTNSKLFFRAEGTGEIGKDGEGEVRGLVSKWSALNYVRSLFPFAGAVMGLIGSFELVVF